MIKYAVCSTHVGEEKDSSAARRAGNNAHRQDKVAKDDVQLINERLSPL
jgi:hypothetical protein